MALLSEQQSVHKNVMEQTLQLIKESETLNTDADLASLSLEASVDDLTETEDSDETSPPVENGTSATTPSPPPQKRRKPRHKANRKPRRSNVSTRTAAVCSPE